MTRSAPFAAVILASLFSTTAMAQDRGVQPAIAPDPVEETETTEDETRRPVTAPGPDLAQTPETGVAATTPADEADTKWDVNARRASPSARCRSAPTRAPGWMSTSRPMAAPSPFRCWATSTPCRSRGGTPTRIAEGLAWEVQPRFSPDGRRIAFTSDRGGGDNIWLMNADGSDKRQLTKEDFRLLNQPTWSPDGQFIAAKKHFTTGRSLGTGEVWLYHVSGGSGVALVERPNEQHQKELGEPIYAPDGSAIYYTRNVTPGPIFEYAQDSNTDLFNIERYDLDTGEVTTAVCGLGGAVRPQPSPDGKKIAFVRRENTQFASCTSRIWPAGPSARSTTISTGRAGNLGRDRRLSEHGLDARQPVDRVLGGRQDQARRCRRQRHAVIPFAIDDTRDMADAPHPVIPVDADRGRRVDGRASPRSRPTAGPSCSRASASFTPCRRVAARRAG